MIGKREDLANILNKSLLDIWANEEFKNTRKKLSCNNREFSPCNVCDVDGTMNGNVSFENGKIIFKKLILMYIKREIIDLIEKNFK